MAFFMNFLLEYCLDQYHIEDRPRADAQEIVPLPDVQSGCNRHRYGPVSYTHLYSCYRSPSRQGL